MEIHGNQPSEKKTTFDIGISSSRPGVSWMDDKAGWTGLESYENVERAVEESRWKSIVVNLLKRRRHSMMMMTSVIPFNTINQI